MHLLSTVYNYKCLYSYFFKNDIIIEKYVKNRITRIFISLKTLMPMGKKLFLPYSGNISKEVLSKEPNGASDMESSQTPSQDGSV